MSGKIKYHIEIFSPLIKGVRGDQDWYIIKFDIAKATLEQLMYN
jgi:hypothetical protein